LALHQQAADELGGDQLGGAGEEALGEVLGKRGGYGSGLGVGRGYWEGARSKVEAKGESKIAEMNTINLSNRKKGKYKLIQSHAVNTCEEPHNGSSLSHPTMRNPLAQAHKALNPMQRWIAYPGAASLIIGGLAGATSGSTIFAALIALPIGSAFLYSKQSKQDKRWKKLTLASAVLPLSFFCNGVALVAGASMAGKPLTEEAATSKEQAKLSQSPAPKKATSAQGQQSTEAKKDPDSKASSTDKTLQSKPQSAARTKSKYERDAERLKKDCISFLEKEGLSGLEISSTEVNTHNGIPVTARVFGRYVKLQTFREPVVMFCANVDLAKGGRTVVTELRAGFRQNDRSAEQ